MSGASVSPLGAPGVAALTFQQLQRGSRFQDVLASLRAVQVMYRLPAVSWSVASGYGVTGRVRGTDDEIVAAVRAWADAFALKAAVEPAARDGWRAGRLFLVPGFAVVQLAEGVTIGGRLIDPEAGR